MSAMSRKRRQALRASGGHATDVQADVAKSQEEDEVQPVPAEYDTPEARAQYDAFNALIDDLNRAGRLPRFSAAFAQGATKEGRGNCHPVTAALHHDLRAAGVEAKWIFGWVRHEASSPRFHHSWIELNGLAIDAVNGKMTVVPAAYYRRLHQAAQVIEGMTEERIGGAILDGEKRPAP